MRQVFHAAGGAEELKAKIISRLVERIEVLPGTYRIYFRSMARQFATPEAESASNATENPEKTKAPLVSGQRGLDFNPNLTFFKKLDSNTLTNGRGDRWAVHPRYHYNLISCWQGLAGTFLPNKLQNLRPLRLSR
jgi:hypothetical protein